MDPQNFPSLWSVCSSDLLFQHSSHNSLFHVSSTVSTYCQRSYCDEYWVSSSNSTTPISSSNATFTIKTRPTKPYSSYTTGSFIANCSAKSACQSRASLPQPNIRTPNNYMPGVPALYLFIIYFCIIFLW